MKYAHVALAIVSLFFATISSAYAAPATDVQEYANNTATEYFVPSDAQKYNDPYWRRPYEDWSWKHNPIVGNHQSITLQIAAFDVDYTETVGVKSEDDKILVKVAGQWVEVGLLAAAPDAWSFTTFDLTNIPGIQQQVNNGLEVMVDIDWDEVDPYHPGAFRLTLAKATLAVDGGVQACNPNPDLQCTTLQPIQFTDTTNAELNTRYASNQIQVNVAQQGDVTSFPLTLSAGQFRVYNGSGWTMWLPAGAPYNVAAGYLVEVRNYSATGFGETTSAVLNIAGVWDSFDITTQAIDQTPQPFVLTDVLNAEVNTNYLSNVITITDVNTAIPISIVGGEYFISGRGWSSANSTVVVGDQITVRRTSSSQYSDTVSAVLTVGTFSESFDITTRDPNLNVEPFSFIDVTNAEPNQLTVSNTITVIGPEAPVSFSVVNGQYSLNGGIWKNGSGTVSAGDTISVRRYSANAFETTLSATLTVGNQSDSFDITTRAANLNVDPFTFVDKTNASLNIRYNSNSITVSGPELAVPISVVNGSYSVNGGTYMVTASTVKAGDTVSVRGLSANNYETTTSVVLTIGNQSDSFDITTRAANLNVDPFSFIDKSNAELGTSYSSNSITVSGPEQAVSISIVDGEYSVNSGVWVSTTGTVAAGDTVVVRRNSANSYATPVSAILTIGNQSDAFDITTRAADLNVTPFSFTDKLNAELSTSYSSNTITVTGPEAPVSISIVNGYYSVNGNLWRNTASTINAGDIVQVRRNSASTYEATVSTLLTIGNQSDSFDITTRAANLNVDPFILKDITGAELDSQHDSNLITVSGPEQPVSISIVNGSYTINGGAYTTALGTASAGDIVSVRGHASVDQYETTTSAILTIGNQSESFDITTRAPNLNVNPFTFTAVTGVELSSVNISNSVTITGPEAPVGATAISGEVSINGGPWFPSGMVSAGDSVRIRGYASSSYETTTAASLKVGNTIGVYNITTRAAVNNVNAFTFIDKLNAELNTSYTSDTITVSGPEQAVSISIVNGQYSVNGGAWTSAAGSVSAGDTVAVRRNSANTYETAVSTVLTIGNQSDSFDITTRVAVNNVNAFTFIDKLNAELNTSYTSNTITVSGPEQAVAISIVNGQYSVNSGAWTSAVGSVNAGDTVAVRRNSGGGYETAVSTTLSIGNQSDSFDITTRAAVNNVNPFSFVDVTGANLNVIYASNSITVTGPEQSVTISIVGGQYSINGGAWANGPGSVSAGDVVSVRRYSANAYESTVSAVLTIGNQSDSFDITTRAANLNVVSFSFVDKFNAELDTRYNSNSITVSGPEQPVAISIINGSYSVNGGLYMVDPSTVSAGDTVTVRGLSANAYETTTSVVLTVGNQSDSFDITTRAAVNNVDAFTFIDKVNAELNTSYTSNVITVSGPEQAVSISITNGEYSVDGGAWTSTAGTVVAGNAVAVRRNSANAYETMVSTTLTIGGVSDAFDITTRAAANNVVPFSFIDVTNSELRALHVSNAITVSGPEQAVAISIVNGEYSINSGAWTAVAGMVNAGDSVRVRSNAANDYETSVSAVLTVGNQSDAFDITTRAAVLTVEPFMFIDKLNAELNTSYSSNTITIVGPEEPVSISIVNGEYSINGGAWTIFPSMIVGGETVQVRRNSANAYETTVSATLTVGNQSDSFDITTRAAVSNVNAFTFIDKANAELNTSYTSNTITVSGPEQAVSISIVNGEYSVNSGAWTSATGSVNAGDTVAVRRISAGTYETAVSTTLTIGGVSDAFDITTRAAVTNVNAFTFIDKVNAELSTSYTSNTITVSGPEQAVSISIVGGEYSVNGGAWTSTAGSVNAGDTVAVRRNSAVDYSTTVSAVLTIGNQSDSYDITTKAFVPDTTPDPFSFVDVFGAELSTSYTSNAITVTGVNTNTPVSILAGQYRINGGAWTSVSGSVVEGDVIEVARSSSDQYSTLVGAMLTVGSYSDSFDITTKNAADTTPDPFQFIDVIDAELDLQYVSNSVTIMGIDTAVEVTIVGGEYRYNNGLWTNQPQYVVNGDTVEVRSNSSTANSTTVSAVLTVGTVSDSFDITTKDAAGSVCEGTTVPLDPAEQVKLVESELVGFEYSLDIWDPWSTGYCADIVVNNRTDKAKPYPYGVHFKLPVDTQFTGTWNGEVTRNGEDVTVIFPSWMQDVEANSKTLDNEQFGFCAQGKSEPHNYSQYVPDFSNLSIDFIAHNVWNGGYCGHFEMTYNGNEPYVPSPNMFKFNLSQSVEITEYWNEIYTRNGETVTVDLPYWAYHIYQNTTEHTHSGFCTVGDQLPCGTEYNGGNSTIVEAVDVQDTYVASSAASTNYGDSTRIESDGKDTNNGEYVSLLKWDVSNVPQGVAITGAQLTLNIYNEGGHYGLFTMNGAWSEMTASWSNTDIDANQGVLIGTIEPYVLGETVITFNERGIALVQQWIDGGENNGFMIRTMGSTDGIIFDSSEDSIAAVHPKFSVTYKEGATPLTMPTMVKLTEGVNGYNGTEDSHIKSGSPNSNYGSYEYVTADGLSSSSEYIGLLKWDISSLPTNANVVGVEIMLEVYDSSDGQYDLYAMEGAWTESSVTWNSAALDTQQGVLIGTVIPKNAHKRTIELNESGVALVQGWADGSVANNGLIIRSAGTQNGMRFRSSEYGDASKHPTISVSYK